MAILAVGGAPRWAQAVVAILVGLALVPQIWSRRVAARMSPLYALLVLAAAFTALQLIPLPHAVMEYLDPTGSALRDDGAALLGLSPWPAATLDAPSSLRALGFFLILLGVAWIALKLATSERGRYYVLCGVAALCGVTALVVAAHSLFGLTRLYGLYEPEHAAPFLLGPLLNLNHLGCLMAVGTVLGIGLAAYRPQPAWLRVIWLAVVCGCGMASVATVSRGATLSLVVGAIVCVAMLLGQRLAGSDSPRRRRSKFVTNSLPIGVVAACAVIVVVYSSATGVERQLSQTSLHEVHDPMTKFAAWRSSVTLVEESPWVGVGRGAFETAFTRVHPASGLVTFSHAENEYVQAVVDWGVPGAICLALAAIWFMVVAIRRWRDGPLTAAGLGSLMVVLVQSNVDFGVELLGLAVPITAIAATLTAMPLREPSPASLRVARALRVGHVAALVATAIVLVSSTMTSSVEEDHDHLAERRSVTLDDLDAVLQRHPLDYYGYALAADVLSHAGDSRAIGLLNHALTLHPTHPGLHLMAARLLYRTGHVQQATIEYAATLRATVAPQHLIAEIVVSFSAEMAASAIPPDFANLDVVTQTLIDLQRVDVATIWLARVLAARPKDLHACELLYQLSLHRGDLQAAETAGRSCVEMLPDRDTRRALALVLYRKQSYTETVHLLHDVETWEGRIDDKVTAWLMLCDAYAGQGDWDEAKRCLHRLDASGDVKPPRRAEIVNRLEQIAKNHRDTDLHPGGSASHTP